VLFLASCLFSACVAEILLRQLTVFPIHGYSNLRPHPLLSYTLSPHLRDVDPDGFRNPPGVGTRILAIGDSHTQGYNVKYEDSWPARLAARIGEPVYDEGIGGYGVLQYGVLLATLPADTREVLLGLYLANDFGYSTAPAMECITEAGRRAIEGAFDIPVPACPHAEPGADVWTAMREHSAVCSAVSYAADRLRVHLTGRTRKTSVAIDGVPVRLEPHPRFTDRTNPPVAERVAFFLDLVRRFRELRPDVALEVLLIPSEEAVLHAAELRCPRGAPTHLVLPELDLKEHLTQGLTAAGIPVQDALDAVVDHYCHDSDDARDHFYPLLDQHPLAEGQEAYAEAAFLLHQRR
jgi:hypothetical protein